MSFKFRVRGSGSVHFKRLIEENQSEGMRVLELGTYDGQSSVGMIPIIEKNNGHYIGLDWFYGTENPGWEEILANPDKNAIHPHYYDPNQADDTYARFVHNVKTAVQNPNWEEVATIIRGKSSEVSDQVEDNSLDILIIDGDHKYSAAIKDIELYLPKLKNGGIIAFDDVEVMACDGIINDNAPYASDAAAEDDSADGKFGKIHWGAVKACCEVFGDWPHVNVWFGGHGNSIAWTKIDDYLMMNEKYRQFRNLY